MGEESPLNATKERLGFLMTGIDNFQEGQAS